MNQPSFLEKIRPLVVQRVEQWKSLESPSQLTQRARRSPVPKDFLSGLLAAPGPRIIAEIKLSSPSRGKIAPHLKPMDVAKAYLSGGAAALSVLTEPHFFGGDRESISSIRQAYPSSLLLMKDFILDEYQIYLARALGANAVLLICAFLSDGELRHWIALSRELGLTALVETHSEDEFARAKAQGAKLIGVNNRDLHSLRVDLSVSRSLVRGKPQGVSLVSESGIERPDTLKELSELGYDAFLIGTALMETGEPGRALRRLREGDQ